MLLQLLILQQMKKKRLSWGDLAKRTKMKEYDLHAFVYQKLTSKELLKDLETILIALDVFSFDNEVINEKVRKQIDEEMYIREHKLSYHIKPKKNGKGVNN